MLVAAHAARRIAMPLRRSTAPMADVTAALEVARVRLRELQDRVGDEPHLAAEIERLRLNLDRVELDQARVPPDNQWCLEVLAGKRDIDPPPWWR